MAAHPLLYEINTRCLLNDRARQLGRPATLRDIPDTELDRWQRLGFTHVWLMGAWPNGDRVRHHGLQQPPLRERYDEILPDWSPTDVGGSPYGISGYHVDPLLGGPDALADFRARLHSRGLRLILDFIPNHIGLDHPWIEQRPDLLVHSRRKAPGCFSVTHNGRKLWVAHGKDPYFPAWSDTAQLDYRRPATRRAMIHELEHVATLCDGVRCDMAMLVLNDVFSETWKHLGDTLPPESEFWSEAIDTIRRTRPDFLFLAEAYWNREGQLQHLGFDFTYNKPFLDDVAAGRTENLQRHLHRSGGDLTHETRFLENHDEARIAGRLESAAQRAAALLWLALPGMKLFYEGQMEGWLTHPPVQLWRRPAEPVNETLYVFYERLLPLRLSTALHDGRHRLLPSQPAWEGNPSHQNLFVIAWQKQPEEFELIVVNYAPHRSQCRVRLDHEIATFPRWSLQDRLGYEHHHRTRDEIMKNGLYLDVDAWGTQWFHVRSNGQIVKTLNRFTM